MKKKNWKVILQYGAGIFLLSLSVGLAWFLPGWYAGWQDERLLNQSSLSRREEIDFLDTASLDIAQRLKLLKETDWMAWSVEADDDNVEGAIGRLSFLREMTEQWKNAGLLPESIFTSADTVEGFYNNVFVENYLFIGIQMEQGTLPVCVMLLMDEEEDTRILAVMDAEKDILYYLSFCGSWVQEQMARLLGYGSLEDMMYCVLEGQRLQFQEDYSGYDFASVCHAREAVITGSPEELNFDVELKYDNFTGYANRRVIAGQEFGMAVSLGNDLWTGVFQQFPYMDIYDAEMVGTYEWQRFITGETYGMEKLPDYDISYDGGSEGSFGEQEMMIKKNAEENGY